MKILFLARSLGRGGAERQLQQLARAFKEGGDEVKVAVFYAGGAFEEDLAVDGVWLSDVRHRIRDLEQAYDFSTGELTSRFSFTPSGSTIRCEVLTFASREDLTVVCQELSITSERACDLTVRAIVDAMMGSSTSSCCSCSVLVPAGTVCDEVAVILSFRSWIAR